MKVLQIYIFKKNLCHPSAQRIENLVDALLGQIPIKSVVDAHHRRIGAVRETFFPMQGELFIGCCFPHLDIELVGCVLQQFVTTISLATNINAE